jgi:hypothetical protein
VQNEPNSRRTSYGVTTNGSFVQNEPNFAPPQAADGGNRAKRSQFSENALRRHYERVFCAKRTQFRSDQAADGGNCAKRSQIWGDWGMWEKTVVVWAVARPGSETCKTNPILGKRLTASLRTGLLCRTNPICGRPESTLTTPAEMGYDKKGGLRPCENKANSQKGFDTQRHCFMSWPRTGSKLPALSLPFVEGASKMSPRKRSQRRGSGPRNDCVRE